MYFVQWFPYSRVYSWVKVLAHILSVRWTTCQVSVRLFYSFLEFTFTFKTLHFRTFLVVQWFRLRLPMQGVQVWSLVGELGSYMPPGQKTKTWNKSNIVTNSIKTLKMVHMTLEKKMATHSNILTWEIPWTEEPGGLHFKYEFIFHFVTWNF